jgi:hypothetical protein
MNWFDWDVLLSKYGSCDCTIYGGWKVVQHKWNGQTIAKKKSDEPHKKEGCTNLNWYSTPANYDFHVYVDSYFVTSVIF